MRAAEAQQTPCEQVVKVVISFQCLSQVGHRTPWGRGEHDRLVNLIEEQAKRPSLKAEEAQQTPLGQGALLALCTPQ